MLDDGVHGGKEGGGDDLMLQLLDTGLRAGGMLVTGWRAVAAGAVLQLLLLWRAGRGAGGGWRTLAGGGRMACSLMLLLLLRGDG